MTDLNAEYRDWLGQADGGSGLIQDAGTGRRERFNQAASAVLRVRWVRRLLAAVVPLIVLGAGAALVPVWPTAARVELGLSVIFGPVLCFLVLYAVNCASPVWIIPLILVMLVLGGDGAAALPAAGSGHLIGASAMAAIIVGVAGVVLLGLTITGAVVTGERWQRQRQQSGHPVSHDVRIDSDWIWLAPRGPVDFSAIRMVPVLLAGITLITGVIMAGTGVMTIRDGQAMVAGLRAHGVVTPAIADNITTDQLQGGQDEPVTEVQVSFLVPGGRIALTDDTTFDGTYSVPPPKGTGETRAVVRYDPGNVNVFLPETIVEHPSYSRMTAQITVGIALYAAAMSMVLLGWRHKHRRLRVPASSAADRSRRLLTASVICPAGIVALAALRGPADALIVLLVLAPVLTAASWLALTVASWRLR